jgi:hypothetical protein
VGLRVESLGFGIVPQWGTRGPAPSATPPEQNLGVGFKFQGLGFGVKGSEFRVLSLGFGVYGLEFGVYGLWFMVRGFMVHGYGLWVMVYG